MTREQALEKALEAAIKHALFGRYDCAQAARHTVASDSVLNLRPRTRNQHPFISDTPV